MFFFLLWLALSAAVGVFASKRGRRGLGWFFLAVVISPLLAFIFCAILEPKNALAKETARAKLQAQALVEALELARAKDLLAEARELARTRGAPQADNREEEQRRVEPVFTGEVEPAKTKSRNRDWAWALK